MSGVTDHEKCPQCGGVYVVDFNCRTFEESKFCQRCGKAEEYYVLIDDNRNPILDEDGKWQYISEENDGYGSICLTLKEGYFKYHPLEESFDLEELKAAYLEALENPDVDAERSYFAYWDTEKKEIVVLFGEDPGLYREDEDDFDVDDPSWYGNTDYLVHEDDIPNISW